MSLEQGNASARGLGPVGQGEGRGVALGSAPAPGSSPRGAGGLQRQPRWLPGSFLPLCGAHALEFFKENGAFTLQGNQCVLIVVPWKTQSRAERRNRPSFTPDGLPAGRSRPSRPAGSPPRTFLNRLSSCCCAGPCPPLTRWAFSVAQRIQEYYTLSFKLSQ